MQDGSQTPGKSGITKSHSSIGKDLNDPYSQASDKASHAHPGRGAFKNDLFLVGSDNPTRIALALRQFGQEENN